METARVPIDNATGFKAVSGAIDEIFSDLHYAIQNLMGLISISRFT